MPDDTSQPLTATATDGQIRWLIDNYGETLYRTAIAVVRNRQLAEDVVQEVLVKAWTSMPSWNDDVPIRWARVVTRNTAISAMRSSRARPFEEFDEHHDALRTQGGLDDVLIRSENVEAMWTALGHLDEEARVLLVFHEVDGLSYDEIAETTDMTVPAVKSKLYRARLTLRKEIER